MTTLVRVLRIIEYVGPREWVEETVINSINGTKIVNINCMIRAATIGSYPEILSPVVKDEERTYFTQEELSKIELSGWNFLPTGPEEWDWLKADSDGRIVARQGDETWRKDMQQLGIWK